ncbi:VOC family protein [Aliishimia ponticola]|uniref:VOC family protein n=2 Tax=Aliishimia ponticola TaxID=2499833 RepID=A0A4S4N8C2_9RHOB|nr:VOC family protein [Aliishimia ponticola]
MRQSKTPRAATPSVTRMDHLVLTVSDITATLRFYEAVLGMQGESFEAADGTTRWALKFGMQKINLHRAGHEFDPKAAQPGPGTADLCFLTDHPLDAWKAHLATLGVAIELGPVARTGATGPIQSLYLRDPDGNLIEVAHPV